MPKYKQIPASEITVFRDERQRRDLGDLSSLADSILRLGVINPITITREQVLIAGERRLAASKLIDQDYKVPCRFYEELDSEQLQLVELEENIKREEINWRDAALSVKRIHEIYKSKDPEWGINKTAESIGVSPPWASHNCIVADRLLAKDERIMNADSYKTAYNIITRENDRAIDNELNNLIEVEREEDVSDSSSGQTTSVAEGDSRSVLPIKREESVLNRNFTEWVEEHSGRRFNLIHCDFPYGIDHGDSEQGGTAGGRFVGYEDSVDTYWGLCNTLAKNIDKLMTPSGHLMFWFSMKFYRETVAFFEKESDLHLVMEHPLVWYKSDGKGIVSDVNRRPRNVYETALLFSRGDRKILTPVDNCYACPTAKSKALHVSEKPEPMLRHFFRMFIDSYSEVLDPTCGAGSALRAADSLGAKRVLGIEMNEEFANEATTQLRRSRTLDKLSSEIDL